MQVRQYPATMSLRSAGAPPARLHPLALAVLLSVFAPATGEARSFHLLDIGARADLGFTGSTEASAGDMRVAPELGLRIDVLWIFAVEATWKPVDLRTSATSVDARFRASALLYMVSTDPLDLYLKVGVGAMDASHLIDLHAEDGSVHAGLGLEIQVSRQVALGLELLLISDGLTRVEQKAANLIGGTTTAAAGTSAGTGSLVPHTVLGQLGVRYFL